MASIIGALDRIKSELLAWVPDDLCERLCHKQGHKWRRRLLNPWTTVQLMLLQLLASVAMAGLRHVARIQVSAAAICKAKQRLPLAVLMNLVETVCQNLSGKGSVLRPIERCGRWLGHRLFLIDGMSFLVNDSPPLRKKYGRASNQRGTCQSYPVPKLLALMDWSSGMIRKVVALPYAKGERTGLSRLLKCLLEGDLMVVDRGLLSFAFMALALGKKVQCLARAPRWLVAHGRGRKGQPNHRQIRKLGRQDWLVRWTKCRCPKWMSRKQWEQLPQAIVLRQVAYRLSRPGFRPEWAYVITTLLDPRKYPAREIARLYDHRWQIEVNFRELKHTLGMKKLSARTVAGVRKEILCFVLLYNLVRAVMARAAARQKVPPDRIGFKDATLWLLHGAAGEELPELIVNPQRKRATEPRMIKGGRRRYPQLNGRRITLRKPIAEVRI
jgi:hypothetical protein